MKSEYLAVQCQLQISILKSLYKKGLISLNETESACKKIEEKYLCVLGKNKTREVREHSRSL